MKLRFAVPEDAKALLAIYAQYIGTNITFEYSLPSEEEFAARIRSFTGTAGASSATPTRTGFRSGRRISGTPSFPSIWIQPCARTGWAGGSIRC